MGRNEHDVFPALGVVQGRDQEIKDYVQKHEDEIYHPNLSHYDLRGILKYAKSKGVEPNDLTIGEISQFWNE